MVTDHPENVQASDSERSRGSKVGRLIEEYDMGDLGEELERRWLGENRDRQSLRDLADYFNRLLLKAALELGGEQPIEGEVGNLYRLLTDDDVTIAPRTQAEAKLSRAGIDIDELRRDFVSHQAIHTYLTGYRGASLSTGDESPELTIERRAGTIQRLQNRLVAVTEQSLESLQEAGHLTLGSFDVMVGITVHCRTCGSSFDLVDLVDQKGCDCPQPGDG